MAELPEGTPEVNDFENALEELKPDAVCISTYPIPTILLPRRHWKQAAMSLRKSHWPKVLNSAKSWSSFAKSKNKALVVGYILRQHPSWIKFVEVAKTLGTPLVMRMNLNQQSYGKNWETHKSLLSSISPVVDCGVHYVDVMCQMTESKPVRVSGVGAPTHQ